MLARAYHKTYGLAVIIARACNNYGPYQHPEKLIPLMTTNALEGLPLPVYGKGTQVREWLYVEDHCRALEAVLRQGRPGETYNIGSGHRLSNLELVRTLLRLLDKPPEMIQFVADRPAHDFRYALDSRKIRQELQWEPQKHFDTGLAETIHWYRENRRWVESAKDDAYRAYYSCMYERREGYPG